MLSFQLTPKPPFRLDLTVWALRRQPTNVLDRWDGETYRRAIVYGEKAHEIAIRQTGGRDNPRVDVEVSSADSTLENAVRDSVSWLLGTEVDLSALYAFAASRPELRPVVERFRGVKPPRFLSYFETLANGFFFQQISLASGISLHNRFVEALGPVSAAGTHAFPSPRLLENLSGSDLRPLGLSGQKAKAILELASAIAGGLDLGQVERMGDDEALAFLQQFRGVGRWTAHYFLLRGLGRLHVFPGDDVGARNRVGKMLGFQLPPDDEQMQRILAGWQPFGGMVYFHLLLSRLADGGHIQFT